MRWDRHFTICVCVAVWTFVQTIFQLTGTVFAYYLYNCQIRATHYDIILVYLTYFYKSECGEIELADNQTLIHSFFRDAPEVNEFYEFYEVIKDVLERGLLPKQAIAASRMEVYLYVVFIYNSMWAISSVVMFVGANLKLTKSWAVVCIGPWLGITAFSIFFDVVSAVHFGLDIRLIYNYSSWLRFIGVSNYKDFTQYDELEYSKWIPTIPSTIICSLFSRFFIFWVLNVLCFFTVLHIVAILYQGPYVEQRNTRYLRGGQSRHRAERGKVDLNSSEARIRNWQQFYGVIGANNSTTSISSSESRDYNSNDSAYSTSIHDEPTGLPNYAFEKDPKSLEEITQNFRKSVATTSDVNTSSYRRFSDVAAIIEGHYQEPHLTNVRRIPIDHKKHENVPVNIPNVTASQPIVVGVNDTLRNQLPWSYIGTSEEMLNRTKNNSNIYGRPGKSKTTEISTEM